MFTLRKNHDTENMILRQQWPKWWSVKVDQLSYFDRLSFGVRLMNRLYSSCFEPGCIDCFTLTFKNIVSLKNGLQQVTHI